MEAVIFFSALYPFIVAFEATSHDTVTREFTVM